MNTNKKKRIPYRFLEITVIIILLTILATFISIDYHTRQMIKELEWHEDYILVHTDEYELFKEYKEFLEFKELEAVEHVYK